MKELSIEEKAKAWDEALKEAVIAHKDEDRHLKATLERIFPELKESEDERIRKAIHIYLDWLDGRNKDYQPKGNYTIKDMIAWLEKQGEKLNNVYDKELSEILGRVIRRYINDPNIQYTEREKVSREIIPYVERLEKQGEQNLTDKAEPKFKEGDWIQIERGHVMKILDVDEEIPCYVILNWYGGQSVRSISDIDSISHLWTIQDAKDGDVLSFDNEGSNYHSIGIFKRIAGKNEPNGNTYRCYVRYGGFKEKLEIPKNGDELHHCGTSAHPATKEQRDTLIKAMADAGYTFDFEKKELKKIESRQEKLSEFEKAIKQVMEEAIECGDTHNLKADADMLLRLVQKPAWSEEDKNLLKWVTGYLDNKMLNTPIVEERTACKNAIAWLEKLKDEQKPNYCHHEVDLSGCSEEYCKAYYDGWNNCNQQHAQLEAEQKPAWSEEDEVKINRIVACLENLNVADNDILLKDINWLKSLRPQSQWKPSDEQMMQLGWIAKQNAHNILGKELVSLYQDLKNLRKK